MFLLKTKGDEDDPLVPVPSKCKPIARKWKANGYYKINNDEDSDTVMVIGTASNAPYSKQGSILTIVKLLSDVS